jgi:hypothetical protein
MNDSTPRLVRLRSVALWCATTAAATGVSLLTVPTLAAGRSLAAGATAFPDLLVTGCAAASLVATAWLWAITTDVVARVLVAGGHVVVRRPGPVRMLLLAACGGVVLGTTAGTASADEHRPVVPHSLSGLPLPDRATGDGLVPRHAGEEPSGMVRVRPGDSLWTIAEEQLGPRATAAELDDYWHRTYARNVDVIGPDPHLILPGQLLDPPPTG